MRNCFGVIILLSCAIGTTISLPAKIMETTSKDTAFAHQNVISSAPLKSESAPEDLIVVSHSNSRKENKSNIPWESSEENDFQEYSYEIELDSGEDFIRKHLCPEESTDGKVYLFDVKAKICGVVGERGHCGENMAFRPEINSTIFGYCECNFGKVRFPLVYHNKSNMCYSIYTQAYCRENQWLVFDMDRPACVPSVCDNVKKNRIINVLLNGTGPCVRLNAPSTHCSSSEERVQFKPNSAVPSCGIPIKVPSPRLLSPITQTNCPPGSYVSISGRCQGSWSW